MMRQPCGRVVVVSGPSGAGKTTLVDRLFRTCPLPLVRSVSATTRSPRGDEVDGVDYHFVGPERVQAWREQGQFLECFEVFGRGYWYGTLWSEVRAGVRGRKVGRVEHRRPRRGGRDGAVRTTRSRFSCGPARMEELRRRLELRGTDTPEEIEKRLQRAQYEMGQAHLLSLPGRQRRPGPGRKGNMHHSYRGKGGRAK